MFMNLFPKESSGSIFGLVCLIGLLSPSLAHAGFEWTPPPANVAAAPTTPSSTELNAAPAGPLTPEPDSGLPVPVGNVESAPVVTPSEPIQEPIVVDNAPVPESTPEPAKPVVVEAAPVAEPTPTPVSDDVVEGFGKDIPLAMALRDIVPAKYAYAFSPRDIAGVKISWRGGKPWQDVLKDALAPYDFDVSVNENNIVIFAKQYTAPVAAPAASAPVAPPVVPAPEQTSNADPLPLVSADEPAPTMTARRPAEMDTAGTVPTAEVKKDDAPLVRTAVDMNDTRRWEARPGKTLRQTLEVWAKESNVELNWSTPYDYPISNAFYYDGSFAQAVDSLLSTYGRENPNPRGRLYPNLPEGPSVLMVN